MSRLFYAAVVTGAVIGGVVATVKQVLAIRAAGQTRVDEITRQGQAAVAAIQAETAAIIEQGRKDSYAGMTQMFNVLQEQWLAADMTEEVKSLFAEGRQANEVFLATADDSFHDQAMEIYKKVDDITTPYYVARIKARVHGVNSTKKSPFTFSPATKAEMDRLNNSKL